ncbi:hypothetical protein AC1031_019004 [Aphanomyces cochlioides]|nr:hypothetical protein AC1031_019004 [Aphanomyces cochlioides]
MLVFYFSLRQSSKLYPCASLSLTFFVFEGVSVAQDVKFGSPNQLQSRCNSILHRFLHASGSKEEKSSAKGHQGGEWIEGVAAGAGLGAFGITGAGGVVDAGVGGERAMQLAKKAIKQGMNGNFAKRVDGPKIQGKLNSLMKKKLTPYGAATKIQGAWRRHGAKNKDTRLTAYFVKAWKSFKKPKAM